MAGHTGPASGDGSVEEVTAEYESAGETAEFDAKRFARTAASQWTRWLAALGTFLATLVAFSLDATGPFDEFLFGTLTALLVLFALGSALSELGVLRA